MNKIILSFLLLSTLTFFFTSCEKNGPKITKTFNLDPFTKISSQSAISVNVYYGTTQSIVLNGSDNLMEKAEVYVENGTLILKMKFGVYDNNLVADITIPSIEYAEVTGSGNIDINNFNNLGDLKFVASGSGDITATAINMGANILTARLSGSGDIDVSGNADQANVTNSGSGDYDGHNFIVGSSVTELSGSGDVNINAGSNLDVSISGSGSVYYKGIPVITQSITGSGSLVDAN